MLKEITSWNFLHNFKTFALTTLAHGNKIEKNVITVKMKYVYYWVISLSKVNILNELRKYHQNIQGFELSSQIARRNTYSVHIWCFNLILTNPMNLKFLYLRQQSKTFNGPENYCLLQIASCSVEITYTLIKKNFSKK